MEFSENIGHLGYAPTINQNGFRSFVLEKTIIAHFLRFDWSKMNDSESESLIFDQSKCGKCAIIVFTRTKLRKPFSFIVVPYPG